MRIVLIAALVLLLGQVQVGARKRTKGNERSADVPSSSKRSGSSPPVKETASLATLAPGAKGDALGAAIAARDHLVTQADAAAEAALKMGQAAQAAGWWAVAQLVREGKISALQQKPPPKAVLAFQPLASAIFPPLIGPAPTEVRTGNSLSNRWLGLPVGESAGGNLVWRLVPGPWIEEAQRVVENTQVPDPSRERPEYTAWRNRMELLERRQRELIRTKQQNQNYQTTQQVQHGLGSGPTVEERRMATAHGPDLVQRSRSPGTKSYYTWTETVTVADPEKKRLYDDAVSGLAKVEREIESHRAAGREIRQHPDKMVQSTSWRGKYRRSVAIQGPGVAFSIEQVATPNRFFNKRGIGIAPSSEASSEEGLRWAEATWDPDVVERAALVITKERERSIDTWLRERGNRLRGGEAPWIRFWFNRPAEPGDEAHVPEAFRPGADGQPPLAKLDLPRWVSPEERQRLAAFHAAWNPKDPNACVEPLAQLVRLSIASPGDPIREADWKRGARRYVDEHGITAFFDYFLMQANLPNDVIMGIGSASFLTEEERRQIARLAQGRRKEFERRYGR